MKEQVADEEASYLRIRRNATRIAFGSGVFPELLRKGLVPAFFVALALLLTSGYGSGIQFQDGQAALHIDPLKFLAAQLQAWNPAIFAGTHTGFWVPYETPYGWIYGLAQFLHVSQEFAQRVVVFMAYLWCLISMHYCLRSVAPRLHESAVVAGSSAYLFNIYIAFNSQAQIPMVMTYAALPALVGIVVRALRGEINMWRGSLGVALLVFAAAGINPPLIAINVIVLVLFTAVMLAFDAQPRRAIRRLLPFSVLALIATVAINLYWLVPFGDYFRTVWISGVLSEPASMHNAVSSFSNVFRGLGHWAIFLGFDGRPYFPWSDAYSSGVFSFLLWLIVIIALAAPGFRRNMHAAVLAFLVITIVSVPLVVGYYHDVLGNAITMPIYDFLYRDVPGFQMFRSVYKWVAGVEFGICGLYAFTSDALIYWLRARSRHLAAAIAVALIFLPVVTLIPVLEAKINYPMASLPAWEFREKALVGNDQAHRVALFPTQYFEQFDWDTPQFYIEDSLINRPMLYGVLGSAPSEGTDRWLRGAYHTMREGLPEGADMLRVLGVDTILQRDDFISGIDFSFPGRYIFNDTSLTHDLIDRVLRARLVQSEGPLRVYHLDGALPLVYGVLHPKLSALPAFSEADLGDVHAMGQGNASFQLPARASDATVAALEPFSPVLPAAPRQIWDFAIDQALAEDGVRVHPPSADVMSATEVFDVKRPGQFHVFARKVSPLSSPAFPPATLDFDAGMADETMLVGQRTGGVWSDYGSLGVTAGHHSVQSDGPPDPDLIVALVRPESVMAWVKRLEALQRALPSNLAGTRFVYAPATRIRLGRAGRYRLKATAITTSDYDRVTRITMQEAPGANGGFFTAAPRALPYIFGGGVLATDPVRLPARWYVDDRSAYQWGRGDPAPWFLFARDAHVRALVAGKTAIVARASLRVSRLQVDPSVDISVDGKVQRSVVIPGPPAAAQEYDAPYALAGPVPVPLEFTLRLQPGWNDIGFHFRPLFPSADDLGDDVVAASVAPDLGFARIADAGIGRIAIADPDFHAVALQLPPHQVLGAPDLEGYVTDAKHAAIWVAVALKHRADLAYRLFPIVHDGDFQVDFLPAFPNGWPDASTRVAGVWLIWRGAHPSFATLGYRSHGVAASALAQRQALLELPLSVDGKRIGAAPMHLSRGSHIVESAAWPLSIGRLTTTTRALPQTRRFDVKWRRPSATQLDVRVPSSAPFLLVFGESYHPEWGATLDGKPLTHVTVDGFANGWLVPKLAGPKTIVLSFSARRYYPMVDTISILALVLLIVVAYGTRLGTSRAQSSWHSNA